MTLYKSLNRRAELTENSPKRKKTHTYTLEQGNNLLFVFANNLRFVGAETASRAYLNGQKQLLRRIIPQKIFFSLHQWIRSNPILRQRQTKPTPHCGLQKQKNIHCSLAVRSKICLYGWSLGFYSLFICFSDVWKHNFGRKTSVPSVSKSCQQ